MLERGSRTGGNMNREGYRTPTEDVAIARETRREKLRERYGIREGDMVRMMLPVRKSLTEESTYESVLNVRVKEIHEYLITVVRPGGTIESFQWRDFEKRRR